MAVPLLDINRQHEPLREELVAVFEDALRTSRFIKGPELEQFESEFAEYTHTERAVGCASGTDAIILSLQAVGLAPGEMVITTPFTFFATAGAVVRCGGRPVFVDIDPRTYNLDVHKLREWLDERCVVTERGTVERASGSRIAAILPVHLFGQPLDMDELGAVSTELGIPVVEDACQAVGSTWNDRPAGSMGKTGCFSFFPSKNLGALGDGGIITTDDQQTADMLVRLREHGGRGYEHSEVGKNSRLDALQAGFLRVKLRHLDKWHQGRRKNAEAYEEMLEGIPQVQTPYIDPRARSVFNQYTLRVEDRDALLASLRKAEIGCAVYYPIPLHLQECFSSLGYEEGDFPESEKACGSVISIPIFGELSGDEIQQVVGAIKAFYSP